MKKEVVGASRASELSRLSRRKSARFVRRCRVIYKIRWVDADFSFFSDLRLCIQTSLYAFYLMFVAE